MKCLKPTPKIPAPRASRRIQKQYRFGKTLDDPYAWLRDPNWEQVMRDPNKLKPEIREHLDAENNYTEKVLHPIEDFRRKLLDELRGRIKEDDFSVADCDGDWAYYQRFLKGGQYPLLCRRPRHANVTTDETIIFDGEKEAKGEKFFKLVHSQHSPDHALLAIALDRNGSEKYVIEIRDIEKKKTLSEKIANAQGDFVFSGNSKALYYTTLDENHRPNKIFCHNIGEVPSKDTLVYEENDPGFFLSVDKTESGRFILIKAHDHAETTEIRLIDAEKPSNKPALIKTRETGVSYDVSDHDEKLIIRTNIAGALDFKIVEAPLENYATENWNEIVPHRKGCLILSIMVFNNYLVRHELNDALPRIVVRDLETNEEHKILFTEEAYDLKLHLGFEFETDILRFSFSSPVTPHQIYDYSLSKRTRLIRKEQEIPSGYHPENYVCRREFAVGHDGTKIPVTILYQKDTPIDGTSPLLIYGYGSYGYAMPASFSTHVFSLLDRGMVYAIAHIRGGSDCGYDWYLNGKLNSKINTFYDFISAAEYLISQNYTSRGKIVAQGRSAGGMLMGAITNMQPELFKGIIAEVPFVDVINTMSDKTLPLTPPEWVEWGNPILNKDQFMDMASYCPYTNIYDRAYPYVLATGGLTDPRVTYWEPVKWTSKLRYHNTGDNEILCWINMEAGHGGASGRFDRLKEVSLSYSFALWICDKAGL